MRLTDWLFWGVVLSGVSLDQLSKFLVVEWLDERNSVHFFRYFSFNLVKNKGICFGLFASGSLTWLTIFLSIALVFCLIFYVTVRRKLPAGEQVSLGMMVAGVSGNLIDRIRVGGVIDFIDFHVWPVFNLADSLIVTGVFLYGILMIRSRNGTCLYQNW
ncbi:MAG: signal peptidase II [Candidatus Omnitrophica bacterium]|nr:signal peptidase II [Candidatus Omnitrophota bacterium]